jgi:PIN domain nuclease of toxin-antitoxin system
MTEKYVLDACALLALLRDEDGSDVVAGIIDEATIGVSEIFIHKVNLLEVYYDIYRSVSKNVADDVLDEVNSNPIRIISDINDSIFKEAGRLKASYRVSLADTFALATASMTGATLLTSDHHEMDKLEQNEHGIKFQWIR